jgi:hypothetical protein
MTPCRNLGQVDDHFAGRLGAVEEARLRGHLPECADCRERYQRRLLIERLDPRAPGPKRRLARTLGLRAPLRWNFWLGVPGVAMAAAAAVLIMISVRPNGFQARGGRGPSSLEIYCLKGQRPARVGEVIRVGDELAFAYRNTSKKKYLLIFAVDEHSHVFWYHPAWVKSTDEPTAIEIASDAALHELPEAIAQPLDGEKLRVVAWFLDEPLSVKRAEALVGQQRVAEGAVAVGRTLRVEATR